jgi:hypothetical protein
MRDRNAPESGPQQIYSLSAGWGQVRYRLLEALEGRTDPVGDGNAAVS